MSKIAEITRLVAELSDEQQDEVLAFLADTCVPSVTPPPAGFADAGAAYNAPDAADGARILTEGELALLEQAKQDFRSGRTRSFDESMAHVDAELARRRGLRAIT